MKMTPGKKLIPEDFPAEDRELIKRISQVYNPFLDNVVQSLTNAVTIRDNLKGRVYSLEFISGETTAKLPWDLNEKPTSLVVGQITKGNREAITQMYGLAWLYVDNKIEVTMIGLASDKHQITLIGTV